MIKCGKDRNEFQMLQKMERNILSAKFVSEQDEISGVETIGWENHSWKYLSLIGEEKVRLFRFCIVSW